MINHHLFDRNPALFLGLSFYLGITFGIYQEWLLLIPFLFLLTSRRIVGGLFFGAIGIIFSFNSYHYSTINTEGAIGIATVNLESVHYQYSRFNQFYYYKGTLNHFEAQDPLAKSPKNIPVSFKIKGRKSQRPLANGTYRIYGRLTPSPGQRYQLKVLNSEWERVPYSFSFGELRFKAKKAFHRFLSQKFKHSHVRSFLAGLVIGEFSDKTLRTAFSQFGLLHLLAISGFHFSFMAMIFRVILRPLWVPVKSATLICLALTLYLLLLGNHPSVLRAWIAIIVSYSSLIAKRPVSGLNALGLGLIVVLIIKPSFCTHIGFQFSFLATAAILLLFPFVDSLIERVFPKRTEKEIESLSFFEKHLLLILGFFKPVISLNLVTTIASLPLSIFYFKEFPLLSLVYNLFMPFFVMVSLVLLTLGICLHPIPPLNSLIHLLNEKFTLFFLNMTFDTPKIFSTHLSFNTTSHYLIIYYSALLIISIYLNNRFKNSRYSQKYVF
ncbi:MAG: ComEC/Rec2 family competence protein [Parachlamydiaceae bacterium]